MSLTTRCPACDTLFRVVPDQLRISGGWVRCGQCSEVFDASAHLEPLVSAQSPPLGSLDHAAVSPDAPQQQHGSNVISDAASLGAVSPPGRQAYAAGDARGAFAAHGATDPDKDAVPFRGAASGAPPAAGVAAPELTENEFARHEAPGARDSSRDSDPDSDSDPAPSPHFSAALRRADASDNDASSGNDPDDRPLSGPGMPAAVRQPPVPAAAPATDDPLDSVSFVRQARRRERWGRRDFRFVAGLAMAALALALLAQLAAHRRDTLAVLWPELRPALEWLCEPLSCSVGAPRRIESIVIDSSGFQRLRADAYRLTVTLRNQASSDVAMPAFELTLTDTQDQPVLRRVLLPAEIAGASALIGAGGEWSGALTLAVAPGVAASRVAGYRLLAFYP